MSLNDIADAEIDGSGKFKYILIKAKDSSNEKLIVRGTAQCEFHNEIFEQTEKEAPSGVKLECLGGGKIQHNPDQKKIEVFGKSESYGPADHNKSVEILRKKYTGYDISVGN